MWKKVIALNLAIILMIIMLPISQFIAFAESLDIGYAIFYKNDGSGETSSAQYTNFSSNARLKLYQVMPEFSKENMRIIGFNASADGNGTYHPLTEEIYYSFSNSETSPAQLYAQWVSAKDNSILYLSENGTTSGGTNYFIQEECLGDTVLTEGTIFTEQDGKQVVGWQPIGSYDTYFPGDNMEISSNMTFVGITGENYFRLHYRDYSDTEDYTQRVVIDDDSDYSYYNSRLYRYEKDLYEGKIFLGWNSKEDGTGEWHANLSESTPHDLYAQYEVLDNNRNYIKLYSNIGLLSGKKYEIAYLDDSNLEYKFPAIVADNMQVSYWEGAYQDYPANETVKITEVGCTLSAIVSDDIHYGLIYGNGGQTAGTGNYVSFQQYHMSSSGYLGEYIFDEIEMFSKERNVLVGYKGDVTGTIYDFSDETEAALIAEYKDNLSRFTACYETVENGYVQYLGNGTSTVDGKGSYYEELDFENLSDETFSQNKFIVPDGEFFLGWSSQKDYADWDNNWYNAGEVIELSEDIVLYAQFGKNRVTIHEYEYDNEYTSVYVDTTFDTLKYTENSETGLFMGWNTKADGSGEWYTQYDTIPDGMIIDLYPQYTAIPSDGYYYVFKGIEQADGTQLKIVSMQEETEKITLPSGTNVDYWLNVENYNLLPQYGFMDEVEYLYPTGSQIDVSTGDVIVPFYGSLHIEYNENFNDSNRKRIQYHLSSYGNLTVYSPDEVFSDIPEDRVFITWNNAEDGSGENYSADDYLYRESADLYAQWFTKNSVINGTCGDGITWKLTGDGTLTISGIGEMDNNSSWDEEKFWNSLKSHIKSIVIEEGVTYIGNYAFYECDNLESVTIPKSVNRIGYDAFNGCDNLKIVNISDIEAWCSIDFGWDREANPLSKCSELYLNGVLTTNITIPATVTSISNYAFYNCKWLEGIYFEGDLSGVNWNTFDGCTNIKSIGVDKLETWINGARYFEECLTNNSWDLYVGGKLLEDLVIPETVTWMNSNKTFYNCKSIKSVTFHDEYYQISDNMFENCINLSTINLSSSINRIGKNALYNTAFYNSESNWSDGMLCLGKHLVKVKDSVSGEFSIPAKITSIAAGAFEGTDVTKVYIHSNVNNMQEAFADASNLTSVEIASGATYIPYRAFYNCTNLSEIIIPDSVYQVGQDSFNNTAYYNDEDNWENDSLYVGKVLVAHRGDGTGIYTVKDGIKSIASSAFREKNYSGIILPESLIYIGDQAFYNCTNLTDMTLPENVGSLQWGLFYGCTSLKTVILSDGITQISNQVFTDCTSLDTIYNMPAKLNWLGTPIFTNCTTLKDIYYEGTSAQWQKQYGGYNLGIDMSNVTVHCAGDNRPSDACGKELIWSLSNDGVLTISGTGKMYDFEENVTPWESVKEDVRELIVEEGVTKIGAYAFCHCTNLDTVRIPATIKTMGDYAFENSNNSNDVDNVYITDLTEWCSIKFMNSRSNPLFGGTNLYLNNQLIKKLVIPEDVTEINNFAFLGCSSIEEIDIHKNVTNGYYYWFSCSNLKQINVVSDNPAYTSIDGNLFSKDGSVLYQYSKGKGETQYTLPNTVTKINNEAFSGCNKLQTVTLPDGLIEISYWVFNNCTSLKEITLPKTVSIIQRGAFSNCTALTVVNYSGTTDEWSAITIEDENDALIKAMASADIARTSTAVSSDGKTFTITPINIETGMTIILALYNDDTFVEMQSAVYEGVEIPFTTTESYTNAKVMVWENFNTLKPVCEVEIVK